MAHPCKVLPILRRLIFLTGWAASRPERVQEPKSEVATAPIHEPTQVEQSMPPAPFANTRSFWIARTCDMSICQHAIFIPQSHLMSLVLVAWGKQYETGHLGSCWKGSHAAVAGRQAAASMLLRHENSCSLTCVLWDPSLNLSFTIQMIWYYGFWT